MSVHENEAMSVRWRKRVAATVAGISLLFASLLVFHRRYSLFCVCPEVSSQLKQSTDEISEDALLPRQTTTLLNVPVTFTEEILILTPISNAERNLRRYFENLCSLTYPHRLMSIILGEDSSSDNTVQLATDLVSDLSPFFKHVSLVRLPGKGAHKPGNSRHDPAWQLERRRHLALSRNRLLTSALGHVTDENIKWILWLDADIRHIPRDLIRYLLSANQSVVAPNCLWRQDNGQTATFDRNTWRETKLSLAELRRLPPDALMLEGYSASKRQYLNDLKTESDLVHIDGVGGCVLLVAAELHRSGLIFPPFVFDHHIETEGLAKMAARMGVQIYGLPSVNVIH